MAMDRALWSVVLLAVVGAACVVRAPSPVNHSRGRLCHPRAVERFFVVQGEETVLRWTGGGAGAEGPRDLTICDYGDKPVARRRAAVAEGGLEARGVTPPSRRQDRGRHAPASAGRMPAALPAGRWRYEVEVPATKQRFGVVARPPFEGEADRFFAIDSALSWQKGTGPLVKGTCPPMREGLIQGLRRSGVALSRERLHPASLR